MKQIRVGYEGFDIPEEKYQAEVKQLDKIAHQVINGDYGSLQRTLAKAWLLAGSSDKRILREGWAAIVTKYNLVIENEPRAPISPGRVEVRWSEKEETRDAY